MVDTLNKNPISSTARQKNFDVLIVGQGLAGSLLAWELLQQGVRTMVIDNHHQGSSSMVAAGIINPITGHRINLTEHFEDYLSVAKDTFAAIHKMLQPQNDFFFEIAQLRLIKNPGQQGYFEQRLEQENYQKFLEAYKQNLSDTRLRSNSIVKNQSAEQLVFRQPGYGIAQIKHSYQVDTMALLACLEQWLVSQLAFIKTKLDYQQIKFTAGGIEYQSDEQLLHAKKIIFCEGYQAIHNPWLKSLPFKLAKGDILTVETDHAITSMLNWGQWLLPSNSVNVGINLSLIHI